MIPIYILLLLTPSGNLDMGHFNSKKDCLKARTGKMMVCYQTWGSK